MKWSLWTDRLGTDRLDLGTDWFVDGTTCYRLVSVIALCFDSSRDYKVCRGERAIYATMGVTKEHRDIFYFGLIEDDLDLNNIENENTANEVQQPNLNKKKRKSMKTKHNFVGQQDSLFPGSHKRKGVKQARRCENMRQLLNMVEKEDGFDLEFEIFEPTVSAFAELFAEQEKMKVWNDFINCSEEEQDRILHGEKHDSAHELKQEDDDLNDSWEEIEDKRNTHPAFTAQECFLKIDKNIRSYLKRRQVPLGLMKSLEEEVLGFFREWPTSVYVSDLQSSFERMNLHALCQYMDLKSHSYDEGGSRRTQVENKSDHFCPPDTLLTAYLQKGGSS